MPVAAANRMDSRAIRVPQKFISCGDKCDDMGSLIAQLKLFWKAKTRTQYPILGALRAWS